MKKGLIIMVIAIILVVVLGLVAGTLYFTGYFNKRQNLSPNGNFQLDQAQIDSITSYFQSTTDINQIRTYCNDTQNRMSCFYYCRNINPSNAYCTELGNMTRRNGNFTRNGNYTYRGNGSRPSGGIPPGN